MTTPLLTQGEERELAMAIEAGLRAQDRLSNDPGADAAVLTSVVERGLSAKERFVLSNLRLVWHAVHAEQRRRRLPEDELFQQGCVGLLVAVQRFDYRRGFRFATMALPYIRAAIGEFVAAHEAEGCMSLHAGRDLFRLRGIVAALDPASDVAGEASRRLGRPLSWVTEALRRQPSLSFDETLHTPDADVDAVGLDELLDVLSPQERRVIVLRFGLVDGETRTLQAVAELIGRSEATVRRVERAALDRMGDARRLIAA